MGKHKRRISPEERGGLIAWEHEGKICYALGGKPRTFEVYVKKGAYRELAYRFDDTYGIFFQCKRCHAPHVLLWRDYAAYVEQRRQANDEAPYYKVLCIDGEPRLRLAKPDEQVDGQRVTCVEQIAGEIFNAYL